MERIRRFRAELAELEREGAVALTSEQRATLDSHLERLRARLTAQFNIEATDSRGGISLGIRLAALLGGAAFFAALVLFLHRIWGALPTTAHVGILPAFPLVVLAATEIAFRRGVNKYYLSLLVIAAGVGFVMELNALGSILNAAPSPHAFLSWGCFAVLVAYAYGLRLPLYAGVLFLILYSAALVVTGTGGYWMAFTDRPESLLPAAVLAYAIPSLVHRRERRGFGFVYRICGSVLGLLTVFALSMSGEDSYLDVSPRFAEAFYQFAGLALGVLLILHGIRLRGNGLVNLGAAAFIVFLYARLHVWWWDWMPKYLFFLLIGVMAAGLLYLFRRLRTYVLERGAP